MKKLHNTLQQGKYRKLIMLPPLTVVILSGLILYFNVLMEKDIPKFGPYIFLISAGCLIIGTLLLGWSDFKTMQNKDD